MRKRKYDAEYQRKYRETHREYYKKYNKEYFSRPEIKKKYSYAEYGKTYFSSPKWKEYLREKGKRDYKNNPLKNKARYTSYNAVAYGKIKRPEVCSKCNNKGKIEGHHPDYTQPLLIIWLCKKCHDDITFGRIKE